jgi:hypothetical protein
MVPTITGGDESVSRVWILILACIVVPPLWGLAVEWVFRKVRGDGRSRYLAHSNGKEREGV